MLSIYMVMCLLETDPRINQRGGWWSRLSPRNQSSHSGSSLNLSLSSSWNVDIGLFLQVCRLWCQITSREVFPLQWYKLHWSSSIWCNWAEGSVMSNHELLGIFALGLLVVISVEKKIRVHCIVHSESLQRNCMQCKLWAAWHVCTGQSCRRFWFAG